MGTVFRYTLARFRGQIIGWGITMFALALLLVPLYDVIVEQQEQIQALVESYPPEMMAFFGDMTNFATPEGYLGAEFFSIAPLIFGVFAVLAASGLLAADEEKGTLDLILAHPISRTALFLGRLLAFLAATVAILLIGWLSFVVMMNWSALDVPWNRMLQPFLSLLGVLLCFGGLALLFSLLLPSRRLAGWTAGLLLIASYFITSLARINDDLKPIARLSPLNYYQSGEALSGLNYARFLGLTGVAVLCAVLAWWLFQRRDIRVGGEAGWKLPSLRRRARARAQQTTA